MDLGGLKRRSPPSDSIPARTPRSTNLFNMVRPPGTIRARRFERLAGLPIITTDTGVARSLIDGNGEIVSRATPADLGRAVESICTTDPATRAAMSRRSREIALQYSWSEVAQQYLELYRQVRDHQASRARFPGG